MHRDASGPIGRKRNEKRETQWRPHLPCVPKADAAPVEGRSLKGDICALSTDFTGRKVMGRITVGNPPTNERPQSWLIVKCRPRCRTAARARADS